MSTYLTDVTAWQSLSTVKKIEAPIIQIEATPSIVIDVEKSDQDTGAFTRDDFWAALEAASIDPSIPPAMFAKGNPTEFDEDEDWRPLNEE